MNKVNIQFSDSTQDVVIAYFSNAQDEAAYPNQGVLDLSDARWKAFYDSHTPFLQSLLPAPA
jgi:hypothetical protein